MQTLNPTQPRLPTSRTGVPEPRSGWAVVLIGLLASLMIFTACNKDVATNAMETDANGYVCLKCGVKLYTDRSVFIGPKCPKCGEDSLSEVVGYYCEKDKLLSIRPRRGDRLGAVCDKCQAHLVNAMKSPREKDLKAWGATKTSG